MAVGEYVSVSSQRDTEKSLLEKERFELENYPEHELLELVDIYKRKGVSHETARKVAEELTAHDAFAAHVDAELNMDPEELTNPWHAAFASGASFLAGGVIPLIAVVLPRDDLKITATFAAVLIALVITGVLSARVSETNTLKVTTRVVVGGIIAMLITFGVGNIFGAAGF